RAADAFLPARAALVPEPRADARPTQRRGAARSARARRRGRRRAARRGGDRRAAGGSLTSIPAPSVALDPGDRILRRDALELDVGGVVTDSREEALDLESPALEVGAKDGGLLRVRELRGAKRLAARSEAQLACAAGAQVPHPLRLAARRDQILPLLVFEQVDGDRPPLTALPPAHREDARPVYAHARTRERRDRAIEETIDQSRLDVTSRGHATLLSSPRSPRSPNAIPPGTKSRDARTQVETRSTPVLPA